jgi:hypothetical protein
VKERCTACGQRLNLEAELEAFRHQTDEMRGVLRATVEQQSHEPIRQWAERERRRKLT